MLAVILGFVLPIVLVPLVRAVTAIRVEIDQHHLGIREIIPQQVVGNPARSGGWQMRLATMLGLPITPR